MSPAPKAKRLERKSIRLTHDEPTQEDDAEQALKEILAARNKLADRHQNDARGPQEKRTKGRQ
jgi:hypothetical protein